MSMIIRGGRMPSGCGMCVMSRYFFSTGTTVCMWTLATLAENYTVASSDKRHEDCPLVELPEKHGRLLDENDVIDAIHARLRELQTHKAFIGKHGDIDLLGVFPYIAKIKAAVEAESEDVR